MTEFLTIALAHLLGVASPGPDFAVVVRQSVAGGRRDALWTSLGIGTGILVHVAYCILGIALFLKGSPLAFTALKVVAAVYLTYIGLRMLTARACGDGAGEDGAETGPGADLAARPARDAAGEARSAFALGFLTNALNPKASLFFLALFSAAISAATPVGVQVGYGLYLAAATALWFSGLSWLLTTTDVRRVLLRAGPWIERAMGFVLVAIAAKLALGGL